MSKIVLDGVLTAISTLNDGSVKIVFVTQELDNSKAADVFAMRNKYCKVMYTDTNISPVEERMIEEVAIPDGKKIKSRAQRLRAALYVAWESQGLEIDFEQYYATHMDNLINEAKQLIVQ